MQILDQQPGRVRLAIQDDGIPEIELVARSRPISGRYKEHVPVDMARFRFARWCKIGSSALSPTPMVGTYDIWTRTWMWGGASWLMMESLFYRYMLDSDISECPLSDIDFT